MTRGPLQLVKCHAASAVCGLLQLRHSYKSAELYGANYGYRSSLNCSMTRHLEKKVEWVRAFAPLDKDDVVVDIGSNDGTTLSFFPDDLTRIGIDPTAGKFEKFYKPGIKVVPDFFTADLFESVGGGRKASVVTSIAMFYDLEKPLEFVRAVERILADDGIWHFEQSYLPAMLAQTAYDTVCHEHLEYYGLRQIQWMMERCGLTILEAEVNDVNGGSISITAAKAASNFEPHTSEIQSILDEENRRGLAGLEPYGLFAERVAAHRAELLAVLDRIDSAGEIVFGYGASTKGNVILQYCGLDASRIPFIAEVNEEKFGRLAPGSGIPIISEAAAHAMNPDYLLVMPWHFRENLVEREAEYLSRGGKMIFPLPRIEIISGAVQ